MNIYNPPTASQVIGLGTAAVKNTGVSGDAVPVLNGAATTWAAGMTVTGSVTIANDVSGLILVGRFNGAGPAYIVPHSTTTGLVLQGPAGSNIATITDDGLDVIGLSRCDSFRIDQAATVESIASDRTITINANGTDVRLLAAAAA